LCMNIEQAKEQIEQAKEQIERMKLVVALAESHSAVLSSLVCQHVLAEAEVKVDLDEGHIDLHIQPLRTLEVVTVRVGV